MSGILVVAFVVSCGHQLLNCEDMPTRSQSFSDMAECHTRLADLISEQQLKEGPKRRVMGRCQYLLDERRSPDRILLQTARAEQYPEVGFYQSTLDRGELSNDRKPQRQKSGALGYSEHQPHRAKGQVPNNGLLNAMVNWLSIKFGLPLNYDHPTIKFLQTAQITQYRNRVSDRHGPEVIAFYDDAAQTIFLPNNWTGSEAMVEVYRQGEDILLRVNEPLASLWPGRALIALLDRRWEGKVASSRSLRVDE